MTPHIDDTVKHVADAASVVTVIGTLAVDEILDRGRGADVHAPYFQ
jgi:hypothetical protein